MFRGNSIHSLDVKGRLIIPSRFRDVIRAGGGDAVMITRMDKSLFAYTLDGWAKIEERMLNLADMGEHMRRVRRYFLGWAFDCSCDKQGRVLIPPTLREYAGLEAVRLSARGAASSEIPLSIRPTNCGGTV